MSSLTIQFFMMSLGYKARIESAEFYDTYSSLVGPSKKSHDKNFQINSNQLSIANYPVASRIIKFLALVAKDA